MMLNTTHVSSGAIDCAVGHARNLVFWVVRASNKNAAAASMAS
jgi:hypothetical protein